MNNNTKNTNTMDYTNCIWVNHYDRRGNRTESTPYNTISDAIESTEELLSLVNHRFSTDWVYNRISNFVWKNNRGAEIRIELQGDLLMHIRDTWIAVCCNYDTEKLGICTDANYLWLIFSATQLDNEKLFAIADQIYGKGGN